MTVKSGQKAPKTGLYRCVCGNTAWVDAGETVPPCRTVGCPGIWTVP